MCHYLLCIGKYLANGPFIRNCATLCVFVVYCSKLHTSRNLQLIFVTICNVSGSTLQMDLLPGSAPLYVFVLCISANCTLLGSCNLILSLFALYWEVCDTNSVSGYPIDLTILLFGMFIVYLGSSQPSSMFFLVFCLS